MAWCASSAEAETCNFAAAAGRCLASSRGANTGAANSVKVDRTEASVCSDLAEPATGSVAWERAERTSEAENLAASCTSRTALGRTSRGGSAASCAGSAGRRIVTRVHVSFVVPGGGMEGVAAPGTRLKKGHASAARALKRPKGSWHSRPACPARLPTRHLRRGQLGRAALPPPLVGFEGAPAQVAQPHAAKRVQKQILKLDVAVDQAKVMQVGHTHDGVAKP
mmetsp:Transcript_114927/g.366651  ORF Transcript_114927/g.366651 Transcript_114927/m.366651 type:complete len:223 (+) Transcript_114927:254-922(+)